MSIRRRMAKGAAWMVSLRFFLRAVGMVSTIMLARLLLPADFGLVAMATVVMGLIVMFSEMNVEAVLVQRTEIDRSYLDSAFSLKFFITSCQAGLLAASAIPITNFYGEPRLEPIVYVLAFAVFVDGFQNIGVVAFQRELRFHREFVMRAAPKIIAFIVTLSVAFATRSYWALVVGILTNHIGRVILSYVLHPYRPRLSSEHWNEIFRFSKWLIANQFLNYLGRRGPDVVLGRLVGANSVGLFSVAYEISTLPTTEMVQPINRAVFPGYARMHGNDGDLRRGYFQVSGLIALFAVPAGVGIAAASPVLIPLLLGENWLEAVPLVSILSLAGIVLCLAGNSASVFVAIGRPQITTGLSVIRIGILVPAMIYGASSGGALGIAIMYLIVLCAILPVYIFTTVKVLSARLRDYVRVTYRPLLAAAMMYALLNRIAIPWLQTTDIALWIDALVVICLGAGIYIVSEFSLWQLAGRPRESEAYAMEMMEAAFSKLRPQSM